MHARAQKSILRVTRDGRKCGCNRRMADFLPSIPFQRVVSAPRGKKEREISEEMSDFSTIKA